MKTKPDSNSKKENAYETIKTQLLAEGISPFTQLDPGQPVPRLDLQRRIRRVLTRRLDLEVVAVAFKRFWGCSDGSVTIGDDLLRFRGKWQGMHLLALLADMYGVEDPSLQIPRRVTQPPPAREPALAAAS